MDTQAAYNEGYRNGRLDRLLGINEVLPVALASTIDGYADGYQDGYFGGQQEIGTGR